MRKINPHQLIRLSKISLKPIDINWVEWENTNILSNSTRTKVKMKDGTLFVFNKEDKCYELDLEILSTITDCNNWSTTNQRTK